MNIVMIQTSSTWSVLLQVGDNENVSELGCRVSFIYNTIILIHWSQEIWTLLVRRINF